MRQLNDERAKTDPKATDRKRLAEALRANLKRRKAAITGRADARTTKAGTTPADKD